MATIAEHLEATQDPHLSRRLVGGAHLRNVSDAHAWATANIPALLSARITVNGSETTLTDLHAYASASFQPGINPAPGEDSTKISDAAIFAAIDAVHTPAA